MQTGNITNNIHGKLIRGVTVLAIVATLILGAVFAATNGFLQTPTAGAQSEGSGSIDRTITVVGSGTVNIRPDIARVQIGVETMRASVQEASALNRETLDAVLEALLAQDIAESDIQTSGFSVFAERYGPEGPLADDQLNYRVSNMVRIIVRDLDSVGEILDAAIEAGANNIYGVEFALDDNEAVKSDARAQAVEDARAKAEELAALNGVSVGRVVAISEIIGGGYFPQEARNMAMGGGGGTSIAPGELEIVRELEIVYELVD